VSEERVTLDMLGELMLSAGRLTGCVVHYAAARTQHRPAVKELRAQAGGNTDVTLFAI